MTPQEQLCEKMRQEQNKYYDWLTAQPPEEILRHAYEYSVREDMLAHACVTPCAAAGAGSGLGNALDAADNGIAAAHRGHGSGEEVL